MWQIFLEGFFLQASLILALGAQNLFVLESGLKKEHHYFVAFICSLCDASLISIGVMGAASIFVSVPVIKIIFGLLGVGFLFSYGLKKFQEFLKPHAYFKKNELSVLKNKKDIFLLTLSFSLLNPHVYLDTVILIGGYSAKYSDPLLRFVFGGGASLFSVIWFFLLSMGGSFFSKLLRSPSSMRKISLVSASILFYLTFKLGQEVFTWIAS